MGQNPKDNSIGVFTVDTNLVVQVWDAELERASGLAAADARGQSIVALFPDLETRGLVKYFHRVFKDSVVVVLAPAFHHYLIPCPPRSASSRFDKMQQRVTLAPLREGDRTVGIIVSLEDVTARIDRERDLAAQLEHEDEMTRLQAAQKLAEDPEIEPAQPLLGALKDESWRVRRAAVAGFSQRAAPDAIAALLESVREDHSNLSLLNSALQVLALSDVDTLSPLIEFLRGDDADLRMQAALALGEQGDERAIPALLAALNDSDVNVVYHAIEALGKLHALEATELLTTIAERRDFFLSFVALEALVAIGDERVTPRIVPLLDEELLREAAATLLGRLGNEQTVAPLADLLNTGQGPAPVIARALATLYQRYQERFGEGEHIADLSRRLINAEGTRALIDALFAEPATDLRSLAQVTGWLEGPNIAQSLTLLLGKPEARSEVIEALVRHGADVTQLLLEQLAATELETRKAAVIALGRIGDNRATPALINTLRTDEQLVIAAADSLARIGDARAFEALVERVGDDDAAIRQAVIGALNSLGAAEAPARVQLLLRAANPHVRESAIKIAGYFGYRECADQVVACCRDEDEGVRRAAIEHVPYFEDERGLDALAAALSNDTPKVRTAAAGALAYVDKAEAIPPLLKAINDPEPWVRYFAARSLGRHRAVESVETLAALVSKEKFNHVRIAALDALGAIGGVRAAAIAAAVVDSGDPDMTRAAIAALGQMDQPEALEPLIRSSRSPDASIRSSAVLALGARGGEEVVEHLRRAVMDPESAVFESAIASLGMSASEDAIASLIDLVADPLRRNAAIKALAQSGDNVEEIGRGLSHPLPEVRAGLVEALARMKSERASELMKTALRDEIGSVRLAAANALGIPLPRQ
jgi:HEAT repeat protein